jgi:hypothetical protein
MLAVENMGTTAFALGVRYAPSVVEKMVLCASMSKLA